MRPALAAYLTGRQELAKILDQGLTLGQRPTRDQLQLLGQAVLGPPGPTPTLTQEQVQAVQRWAGTWPDRLAIAQHELDHRLNQNHDHGRLRDLGLPHPHPQDQVHDQEQVQAGARPQHNRQVRGSEHGPSASRSQGERIHVGREQPRNADRNERDVPDEDWNEFGR